MPRHKISEVARRVNLSQKRIREYEKEGFLKPERSLGNQSRLYTDFEIEQVRRITYLIHSKGFTLACLKQLLLMANCWDIFDCPRRQGCPAYARPNEECWQVRRQHDTKCEGPCDRCAIYLVASKHRRRKRERILLSTRHDLGE